MAGFLRHVVVVLATGCVVLSACSANNKQAAGAESEGSSAYVAEIKRAAANADTDYETAVMSDGIITRREYDETVQRTVDCAEERGVTVDVYTEYGLNRYAVSFDTGGVFDQCSETYLGVIESLYSATIINPSNEDMFDLTAECFRRSDLIGGSFTGDDLKRIIASGAQGGNGNTFTDFPFDTSDERYLACTSNPANVPESDPAE